MTFLLLFNAAQVMHAKVEFMEFRNGKICCGHGGEYCKTGFVDAIIRNKVKSKLKTTLPLAFLVVVLLPSSNQSIVRWHPCDQLHP